MAGRPTGPESLLQAPEGDGEGATRLPKAPQTEAGAGVAQEVTPCPAGPDPVTSLTSLPRSARQRLSPLYRQENGGRGELTAPSVAEEVPRPGHPRGPPSPRLRILCIQPELRPHPQGSAWNRDPAQKGQVWTPETHTSQPSAHVARKPIGRRRRDAECVARTPAVPLHSQVSRLDVTSSFLPVLLPRLLPREPAPAAHS